MKEYIEREAVLSAIWKTSAEHDLFFPAIILDAIKAIPAADVRPVKRAHWKEDWEMGCSECSECGEGFLWEDFNGVYTRSDEEGNTLWLR